MGMLRTFVTALSILLFGCVALPDDNIENAQLGLGAESEIMPPLIPVGPAVGGPFATIDCPVDGATIVALDIRRPVAALLRNDELHDADINTRVLRAGDTMTDSLTVNASTPNATAITGNGDGNGIGVVGLGGATGRGGVFTAGGGNNNGADATGTGTGAGIRGVGGATGAGGSFIGNAGDNTAIALLSQGGTRFDDTPPAATTDPGFDNTQWSQSIVSSSAVVTSDGVGGFAVNANGFNVATFAGTAGGIATITFARALPGNNYRPYVFAQDIAGAFYDARWNGVQNVGNFQFTVRDGATNALVNLLTTALTFYVTTVGY